MKPHLFSLLAMSTLGMTCVAHAQTEPSQWRAIAGVNSNVVVPGLPAGGKVFDSEILSDTGAGRVAIRLNEPLVNHGYWAFEGGTWRRFASNNSTGAIGPGRSGAESAHVFKALPSNGAGAASDGQRLFNARAGATGNSTSDTWGMWRWDGSRNVEIARALTDGPLGPGLGAGWVFQNNTNFGSGRMLANGEAVMAVETTSPTNATRLAMILHRPDAGNIACTVRNATDAHLSPGLSPGDFFTNSWSTSDLAVSTGGKVYARMGANNGRYGIWEMCNGAPQARVANNEAGAIGPNMGSTSVFAINSQSDISIPKPGQHNTFFFFTSYRSAPGQSGRAALFWNNGSSNHALAANTDSAHLGPHWLDSTWRSFNYNSLTTGGDWAAFTAQVNTTDGGNPSGLWRVRTDGQPELVGLIGLTGAYGPEADRTWHRFISHTVLSNGDIITLAETNPGNEVSLWLLKNGQAPRRILKNGDTVAVPTTSGLQHIAITGLNSLSLTSGGATYSTGQDDWSASDGSLLLKVNAGNFGTLLITSTPSDPAILYANGFE